MICPYCKNNETKVLDKRSSDEKTVRRRRECLKCGKRFTTYERIDDEFIVIKKDGRREPYSREKIKTGIMKSCEKRPVSIEQIEKMIDEIEANIREENVKETSSKVIGDMIMKKLKKLDKVAYIRFASVYHEFADLNEFKRVMEELAIK